jgi:hypothetical protein
VIAAIGWGSIAYGAVLSALLAAVLVALLMRERRPAVLVSAALAAAAGPVAWNAILHDVGGDRFFHDAPIVVFPVSYQDTGSGVFATAAAALILGFGALRAASGRALAAACVLCGVSALLVDVYLY